MADGRVFHLLKGLASGALSQLNALRAGVTRTQAGGTREGGIEDEPLLENAIEQIEDIVEWSHRRQLFVDLERGEYVSRLRPCALHAQLASALGNDGTISFVGPDGAATLPPSDWPELACDDLLLFVTVQEALSNARKYREPSVPIVIRASFLTTDEPASGPNGERSAHGLLRIVIENVNRSGCHRLTEAECIAAFVSGVSFTNASTSSGIGLSTAAAVLSAGGGKCQLSTREGACIAATATQSTILTSKTFEVPARAATAEEAVVLRALGGRPTGRPETGRGAPEGATSGSSPAADSYASGRPAEWWSSTSSSSVGEDGEMLQPEPMPLPQTLRVVVADDSRLLTKLLSRALRTLGGQGWHVVEVQSADCLVRYVCQAELPVQLVITDENMNDAFLGSAAIRKIREYELEHDAPRTVVISCTSDPDKQMLLGAGADDVWGKPFPNVRDGSMKAALERLLYHPPRSHNSQASCL